MGVSVLVTFPSLACLYQYLSVFLPCSYTYLDLWWKVNKQLNEAAARRNGSFITLTGRIMEMSGEVIKNQE
ncbi:hypothetical protein SAMN04487897_1715 [Paenibacillus sp. yr247]|nr:hypothetical protein SAMN04487897_1715 [Paenibacillus sp. yr247]